MPDSTYGPRGPAPEIDVTSGHDIDRSWPAIAVPFANGVIMTPAIQYATPPGCRPLTLDLYRPGPDVPRAGNGFPLILFIHGGGWTRGDSRASRPMKAFPWLLAALSARGYGVASIDYRLTGEAIWPAQAHDVKAAVRFLRRNAPEFGIDPDRFASWGVSCGGHLTAVLCATAGVEELSPTYDPLLAGISDAVQAGVSWYGGFDMESITDQSEQAGGLSRKNPAMPEWALLGGMIGEVDIQFARSAGPINYVHPAMPPMLFCVGDKDRLIPHVQTLDMVERMRTAGAHAELEMLAGTGHDFAGDTPGQTRAANQHALDVTVAFLDRVLRS